MIGWLSIEQVLASVAVNVIGLVAVQLMRSAPPRVVLYVCLSVMLAIVMPWGSIGVAPLDIGHGLTGQGNPQGLSTFAPSEAVQSQTVLTLLGYVWVCVGILWLLLTVGAVLSLSFDAINPDPHRMHRLLHSQIRRSPHVSNVLISGACLAATCTQQACSILRSGSARRFRRMRSCAPR